MDAFYASVEQRDFPELKGKPIAVGGTGGRGVVSTCSYEARQFGVRSAMPSHMALRKCPQLIFMPPRFDAYKAVSQKVREIFLRYTELIEPLSLDEAYLDVTEAPRKFSSATEVAFAIKENIAQELELSASAGISYCKFLAKIASDMNKPDGCTLIRPEKAQSVIDNLPIERFFGIGEKTALLMKRSGIHLGKDLRALDQKTLTARFGKAGKYFYHISRGIDEREVQPNRARKSVSIEATFPTDIQQEEVLFGKLQTLIENLWQRAEKAGFYGRTVNIKLKFSSFKTETRSLSVEKGIRDQNQLRTLANQLFQDHYSPLPRPVRLLGVGLSNEEKEQEEENQLLLNF